MDSRSAIRITAATGTSSRTSVRILRHSLIAVAFVLATTGHAEVLAAQIDFGIASSSPGRAQSLQPSREPTHADILEKHQRGERRALRVREDTQRHRLWVLTLEHVYVYDTRKRTSIGRIRLPNWPIADFMCPPDVVLGRDGTIYVSNNVQPRILQIGPAGFHKREYQLKLVSDRQWEIGFGALAFAPDGTLFGMSTLAGAVFRIDLAGGTAREVGQLQAGETGTAKNACALTVPERMLIGRGGEI